jgi:tetratricopeptide (TPR) repeat protein
MEEVGSLADIKKRFWEGRQFFLLVAVLCLAVYFNALGGEFVSDDIGSIVENPNIGDFFLALKNFNVLNLSRALIFHLCGQRVWAYHTVNLLLHIGTTILVYFFILILTKNDRLSTLATLLFALHPVHTEAVSWISGGGYVLYSFFLLLSFLFFHLSVVNDQRRNYLITAWVLYVLAISSGIWAVTLLPLFFLYEFHLSRKKISWPFYLGLVLVAVVGFYVNWKSGAVTGKIEAGASVGGTRDWTITAPHSLVQYFYLLLWPLALTIYHEGLKVGQNYVWLSRAVAVLTILAAPLFLFWRKEKVALFFLLFFLASISLSLSPVKIGWYVAERYLYLGSISFCVLVAALLLWLEKRQPIKNLALFLLIPILVFYSWRAWSRNNDWRTQTSFWTATARASPTSFRAWNNLGNVYGWEKKWDQAIEAYQQSLKIKPDHDTANFNLGIAYYSKGDLESAKKYFLRTVEVSPKHYRAYYNLGLISYKQGNFADARKYWEQALRLNPNYTQARQGLDLLEEKGL